MHSNAVELLLQVPLSTIRCKLPAVSKIALHFCAVRVHRFGRQTGPLTADDPCECNANHYQRYCPEGVNVLQVVVGYPYSRRPASSSCWLSKGLHRITRSRLIYQKEKDVVAEHRKSQQRSPYKRARHRSVCLALPSLLFLVSLGCPPSHAVHCRTSAASRVLHFSSLTLY